jgi:hypothetical protein
LVASVVQEAEEEGNIKLGIHHKGDQCLKPSEPNAPAQQYFTSTPGTFKTGPKLIELLLTQWSELDCISADGAVAAMDVNAWRQLKKRIPEIIFDIRTNGGDRLKYCVKGIGNDATCNLQIPLDGNFLLTVSTQDMEKQLLELPYNAAKLHLGNNIHCLSKALDICDRAKKLSLPVIIETTSVPSMNRFASLDTFEADFAVGVGAVQFFGNGLYDTNFQLKLMRFQEILSESNNQIPFVGSKFRSGPM